MVLGKADNAEDVAKVVKDYQSKGILTFMIGECIEQALEQGVTGFAVVQLGLQRAGDLEVADILVHDYREAQGDRAWSRPWSRA